MKKYKLKEVTKFTKKKFNSIPNLKIYLVISVFVLGLKIFWLTRVLKFFDFENPDSEGYLSLASNLHGAYFNQNMEFNELTLLRTPGYPLFLAVLNSNKILVIATQLILHIVITFLTLFISKLTLGISNSKTGILAFLIVQIEISMLVYSYLILTEILFTCVLMVLLYLILKTMKNEKFSISSIGFFTLLLFLLLMIRPIGIAISAIFMILIVLVQNKKVFIYLFTIVLGLSLSYSTYNLITKHVFTMSTSQNFYLFIYQGVASKSLTIGENLESVSDAEVALRDSLLGDGATYSQIDSYNRNRALNLITENKVSFLKLNASGIFKLLYSPNRTELIKLLSDGNRIKFSENISNLIIFLAASITFVISTLGIIGAIKHFRKSDYHRVLAVTLFIFIILSSGANAYARFRVPIAPILSLYCALELYNLAKRVKNYKRRYHISNSI